MPRQTANQRVLSNGLLVTIIDLCSKGMALGLIIGLLGITGEQLGILWSGQIPHLFTLHNLQIALLSPAAGGVLGIAAGLGIYGFEKCARPRLQTDTPNPVRVVYNAVPFYLTLFSRKIAGGVQSHANPDHENSDREDEEVTLDEQFTLEGMQSRAVALSIAPPPQPSRASRMWSAVKNCFTATATRRSPTSSLEFDTQPLLPRTDIEMAVGGSDPGTLRDYGTTGSSSMGAPLSIAYARTRREHPTGAGAEEPLIPLPAIAIVAVPTTETPPVATPRHTAQAEEILPIAAAVVIEGRRSPNPA